MTEISTISLLHQKTAPPIVAKVISAEGHGQSSDLPTFSLKDFLSQKKCWLLLFFHPIEEDSDALVEEWKAISEHVQLFGHHSAEIFVCSNNFSSVEQWYKGMQFSVLLDEDFTIGKSYEVVIPRSEGAKVGEDYVRAAFLISPEGIIRKISLFDTIVSVREMEELLSLLVECQSAQGTGQHRQMITTSTLFQQLLNQVSYWSNQYSQSLTQHPIMTKSITSALIAIVGEIIGSAVHNYRRSKQSTLREGMGRSAWEVAHRVIVFGVYGLSFTGPFFHWWYRYLHQLVSSWNLPSNLSVLLKVLINQLVMTPPFLLFTISFLQFFMTFNRQKTIQILKNSFVSALLVNWKVWTVAQVVNFGVIPMDYQVLFGNLVALWWNIYLSLISSTA